MTMTATYAYVPAPVKRCSQCRAWKGLNEFYRCRPRHDGLQHRCNGCQRRYYETNAEAKREYLRHYRAANAEALREQRRRYREDNAEAIRERKNARNRERGHPSERNRRARQRNAPADDHTHAELLASWEDRGLYGCYWCESAGHEHVDHVIPLARGGAHSVGNLVPSCARCNQSKGAKLPLSEWWPSTPNL